MVSLGGPARAAPSHTPLWGVGGAAGVAQISLSINERPFGGRFGGLRSEKASRSVAPGFIPGVRSSGLSTSRARSGPPEIPKSKEIYDFVPGKPRDNVPWRARTAGPGGRLATLAVGRPKAGTPRPDNWSRPDGRLPLARLPNGEARGRFPGFGAPGNTDVWPWEAGLEALQRLQTRRAPRRWG